MNLLLFILDYTIFIPITLIRLIIIYFYGSKYNINGLEFMDVMQHANNKYFNQTEEDFKVDTIDRDLRYSIYDASQIGENEIDQIKELVCEKAENGIKPEKIKSIYEMLIEENNSRIISDDLDEEMPSVSSKKNE